MTPDYSPIMLKAFLQARCVLRAAIDGQAEKKARVRMRTEIKAATGLLMFDIDLAFRGHLNSAVKRAKIWGVLDVCPDEFGVLLLDNGGQE